MSLKKIYLILLFIFIGCENKYDNEKTNHIQYNNEKYEKCMLLLDLKWGTPYVYEYTRKTLEILKKNDKDYKKNFKNYYFDSMMLQKEDMVFIFSDKCNEKEFFLKDYVEKYLVKINGFPTYEIKPILKLKEL